MDLKERVYDCDDDEMIVKVLDEVAKYYDLFVIETGPRTYEVRDLAHNVPACNGELSLEEVIDFLR